MKLADTHMERNTNFIFIELLRHCKYAKETDKTTANLLLPYRKNVLTITNNNWGKFALHEDPSKMHRGMPVFFSFSNSYTS